MQQVKYGKIKKSDVTNIFATTVQLIIRMKQLIEGQFKNFIKNPKSEVIPAIIDIYEQLKSKQEYLVIDSFIHAMINEFHFDNYDAKFVNFFSSAICSIDFSVSSYYRQICFTTLKDKTKGKDKENYIFDISFEKNKKLSEIIQDQYEFSNEVIYEPSFLFFSPVNNDQLTIPSIDDKVSLKNKYYTRFNYNLSIIVVKKIQSQYMNHFVLYVGAGGWIQIEDDEIFSIRKENIFKEIINTNKYRIELLGYCRDPEKSIVMIDTSDPSKIERYDFDELKQNQSKSSPTNYPSSNRGKELLGISQKSNVIYTVTFVEYDYNTSLYKIINERKLKSSNERDKYLNELGKDSQNKNVRLFFDNGKDCSATNCFDAQDFDISVYSIDKSWAKIWFDRMDFPYIVYFREYFNNDDDDVFDEEELPTQKFYFNPRTTTAHLLKFGRDVLPGNPETFYLKNKKTEGGVKMYYDLLLTSSYRTTISSIFKNISSVIVYYKSNKNSRADSKSKQSSPSTKTQTETKPSVVHTKYFKDSKQSFSPTNKTTEPKQLSPSTKQSTEPKQSFSPTNPTTDSKQSSPSTKQSTESKQSSPSTNPITDSKSSVSQTSPIYGTKPSYLQTILPETKATNISSENDDIVITRNLRNCIYYEKDGKVSNVKKITFKNKSKKEGFLKELVPYLLTTTNLPVASYYIIFKGNRYIVKYLDQNEILIKDLPPYFNFQIQPHKSLPPRICVLYRSPTFNRIDINKECFSFAINFPQKPTYPDFLTNIMKFLFKGKDEKIYINDPVYQPSLYFSTNNTFVLIDDIQYIKQYDTLPIFVIWKSTDIYDFMIKVINKNTTEECHDTY